MSEIKLKIDSNVLPQHVAIIMDGNGRWAQTRGKERSYGHQCAVDAVRNAINACNEIHIPYLTLYAFSTENWSRPADEVSALMTLLSETLLKEGDDIFTKGLRLHVIGDISELPDFVSEQLLNLIDLTKENDKGNLILALNYGSQKEIVKAVKEISQDVKDGKINKDDIDENLLGQHLYTKDFPNVDLMIRTSGEVRISNFLLWQIAYAELQFLDILWPDFTKDTFFQCILDYQNKERRFGKTSQQVQQ
ncbi:isoprenyl transferase [Chryseobacterium sp. T1]